MALVTAQRAQMRSGLKPGRRHKLLKLGRFLMSPKQRKTPVRPRMSREMNG